MSTKPILSFTSYQREVIQNISAQIDQESVLGFCISEESILEICNQASPDVSKLSINELVAFMQIANALYRAGVPIISDMVYDGVFIQELVRRDPDNAFLHTVEPETEAFGKAVPLPAPMLSTLKTYTYRGIEEWLGRVLLAAQILGIKPEDITIRATPKLDGYAGYDDGGKLYTRGDGRRGTDISHVFKRGVRPAFTGIHGHGPGELVVRKPYFDMYLASEFECSRNFNASIIKEGELSPQAQKAINCGAVVFVPFNELPGWEDKLPGIMPDIDDILRSVKGITDFDIDGVVFEVTTPAIKTHMGSTNHHHRWQIAYKENNEVAQVRVLGVRPQTSRTGRVNPVADLEPTKLSGATLSKATVHHYGMVKEMGVGANALVELTRSGLVIPKINRVLEAASPQIPSTCPSCGSALGWEDDYLYCPNTMNCAAQIENSIYHFFKTMANNDGYGLKTIERLHKHGISTIVDIYNVTRSQLTAIGFGEQQAVNLLTQLQRSKKEAVEDWRFLGAFGLKYMGRGNCERLLQHHSLMELFKLTVEDIVKIDNFAVKSATAVVAGLKAIKEDFHKIHNLGFNLLVTPKLDTATILTSPITGKVLVFTGTLHSGKRDELEKQAKQLGAKVTSSVTSKTDWLICGENVGASKKADAERHHVEMVPEELYLARLKAG